MDKNFIIPVTQEVIGEAKMILKGAGLALIKPKFYKVDVDTKDEEKLDARDFDGYIGNMSGMPVFDSITFKNPAGNNTQLFDKDNPQGLVNATNLTLITALISVNKNKNIVLTKIQGRNGTVKEYVSDDDYQISIKGTIVGKYSNKRPIDEVKKLENYCNFNGEIEIVCNFLNDLGVNTVVITSHSKSQREGTRNVVDFEIQCLQETPYEIKSNA